MVINIIRRLKSLIILIFLLQIFIACNSNNRLKVFIYKYTEAIIFKDISLFRSLLMTQTEFKKLNDTFYKGNYEKYLNKNLLIFKKAIQGDREEGLLNIEKVKYGDIINIYNIDLIYNTKIFLRSNKDDSFHTRILFIVKTKSGSYKLFLLNS